jgi:hypothetical protein
MLNKCVLALARAVRGAGQTAAQFDLSEFSLRENSRNFGRCHFRALGFCKAKTYEFIQPASGPSFYRILYAPAQNFA